ncbi:hypothetical protein N9C27_01125 [Luminiphilus sp.]|nr:hypothetical protein [Luminiphilus sp.]MDA9580175.1 hypothetical protein [Luminiphilus sp.]MDA9847456.1 hypothetical protein [Luminiphilus sp.]MDB2352703.1 hypothetical protein [Luminiphilus sp.]MDB3922835.1 hypothetical protein [Luminiphilus sp.]
MMVAITGASGSGKSTLAQSLVQFAQAKADGPRTCLLSLDAYYRDLSHLTIPEREAVNFDRLEAIELPLFSDHLARLRLGERVAVPKYDFSQHTRVAGQTTQMGPSELVVVDGLLLGAWTGLAAAVDYTVFVETPVAVCLQRRLQRDCVERGRTEASVLEFWNSRVLPEFQRWEQGARARANGVVSGEISVDETTVAVWKALAL